MPSFIRRNWSGQPWLLLTPADLHTERLQATDEGRDLSALAAEFEVLAKGDLDDPALQVRAESLLDAVQDAPLDPAQAAAEPNELEAIRAARPASGSPLPPPPSDEATIADRLLGAWLGRCSGCLMGKPVEGVSSSHIREYLQAQGRWPLRDYFSATIDPAVEQECGIRSGRRELFVEAIAGMPEDDDTNYTTAGLALLERAGRDFTPLDVARLWLGDLPIFHVCTAERIAYRNLVLGLAPPDSAAFRNPYREWIGAQIRADFFGYINPADGQAAADMAWRDASISHQRNGIYGEMWVAAMLATAWQTAEPAAIIAGGLAQIPADCRLAVRLRAVSALHGDGSTWEQAIDHLRQRWDEGIGHHWCHTISNAEVVAAALLWGQGDPAVSLGLAIMPGFDTDCNGATVGSILGLAQGAARWPAHLADPLQDTLYTGLAGFHQVRISEMAERTAKLLPG